MFEPFGLKIQASNLSFIGRSTMPSAPILFVLFAIAVGFSFVFGQSYLLRRQRQVGWTGKVLAIVSPADPQAVGTLVEMPHNFLTVPGGIAEAPAGQHILWGFEFTDACAGAMPIIRNVLVPGSGLGSDFVPYLVAREGSNRVQLYLETEIDLSALQGEDVVLALYRSASLSDSGWYYRIRSAPALPVKNVGMICAEN